MISPRAAICMKKSDIGSIYVLMCACGSDPISVAGCGKRTVVKYVARRLGLHVVEYSCHNLMASSERKTSVALAQAFNTAQR
jgi:hypothetical protein